MNKKLKSRNSRTDRINNLITNSKHIKRKSEFLKSKFPNFSKTLRDNNFNIYKNPKRKKKYKNKSLNFHKSSQELCDDLIKKNIKECNKIKNRFGSKSHISAKKVKSLNLSKSRKQKIKIVSPFLKKNLKYLSNRNLQSNFINKRSVRKILVKKKTEKFLKVKKKEEKNSELKINKIFRNLKESKNDLEFSKQNLNQSENSNFTNYIGPEQKNKMIDFLNELKNLLRYEDELKNKTEEIVLEIKKENIYLEKKINIHACKIIVFFFKRKKKKLFRKFFKKLNHK